jgi:hypothetical protein
VVGMAGKRQQRHQQQKKGKTAHKLKKGARLFSNRALG